MSAGEAIYKYARAAHRAQAARGTARSMKRAAIEAARWDRLPPHLTACIQNPRGC